MIAKVLESEWVGPKGAGVKTPKWQAKYPQLVDNVAHGGWGAADKQRQYSPGFKGQRKVIMNVIDRSDIEWHRENLKMKLLSKNVFVSNTGTEFVDFGVPSYGFLKAFQDVIQTNGNWSKYDVAVKRTGEKTNPIIVKNATKCKKKDDMPELKGVSGQIDPEIISESDVFSAEECTWEPINLVEEFKPTSYFMLKKRLEKLWTEVDNCLGTSFIKELDERIADETAEFKAREALEESTEETTEAPKAEAAPEARAVRRETISDPIATGLSPRQTGLLVGWNKLSEQEKLWIKDVIVEGDDTLGSVIYDTAAGQLVECPECHKESPVNFTRCPTCGVLFSN
jgi:hypothetical protein